MIENKYSETRPYGRNNKKKKINNITDDNNITKSVLAPSIICIQNNAHNPSNFPIFSLQVVIIDVKTKVSKNLLGIHKGGLDVD